MDRINGANTVDIGSGKRGWRKQNKASGVSGTEWTETFQNGLQEEVMAVIEGAGITPSDGDWTQLRQAINKMVAADLRGTRTAVYSTPGITTFTVLVTGWHWVECYGAGGGAGRYSTSPYNGEGGGGGGYAGKWVFLTAGDTVPVTVGAAGTGSGVGSGTGGGTTSFGAYCSATGGGPGTAAGGQGAGGIGIGGDINLAGQDGESGNSGYSDLVGRGGSAAGPFGGKGSLGSDAGAATWPGGGGCISANTTTAAGGTPAAGGVIIRY